MKKAISLFTFLALLLIAAPQAQAQLTFYNGSACQIKVKASSTYDTNPCLGPYCATSTYWITPGSFFTIPAGICPAPSPTATHTFRYVKFAMQGSIFGSVDLCGSSSYIFLDCQGASRTLQIFSGNFALIN